MVMRAVEYLEVNPHISDHVNNLFLLLLNVYIIIIFVLRKKIGLENELQSPTRDNIRIEIVTKTDSVVPERLKEFK